VFFLYLGTRQDPSAFEYPSTAPATLATISAAFSEPQESAAISALMFQQGLDYSVPKALSIPTFQGPYLSVCTSVHSFKLTTTITIPMVVTD
jgi:hypothetical protein